MQRYRTCFFSILFKNIRTKEQSLNELKTDDDENNKKQTSA